jgi:cytochrome oxidase Cu insertion factor (SCO1/SenC/PrrC family)
MRSLCRTVPVLLLLVLLGACGSGSDTKVATPNGPESSQPGKDVAVTTFEGERFSLAEHRGTPVVLNFWESW